MNTSDLVSRLPRASKYNEISYESIPKLLDKCFNMWSDQIRSRSKQSKGGEGKYWYFGLLCYLRSLETPVTPETKVPNLVIGQTVPYKMRNQMVQLNNVFTQDQIEAIITLL